MSNDKPYEKGTNPKDAIGSDKIPMHLWPASASIMGSLAMLNGACKYGRSNFRAIGVRASIYVDACKRHLDAWFEGEEHDPDDGVPHLSAALACIAIIVDAIAAGKLTDDRMINGNYREFINKMTPYVKAIKERHKDRDPRHYTIADNEQPPDISVDLPMESVWNADEWFTCAGCFGSCDIKDRSVEQYPNGLHYALCPTCRAKRLDEINARLSVVAEEDKDICE